LIERVQQVFFFFLMKIDLGLQVRVNGVRSAKVSISRRRHAERLLLGVLSRALMSGIAPFPEEANGLLGAANLSLRAVASISPPVPSLDAALQAIP